MELIEPEVTEQALSILRSLDNLQGHMITILALVVYVHSTEIKNRNWNGIAATMALYAVHWFVEVINAVIQHLSGHALWTVPDHTSFLIMVGVGIEISLMFSIAGLIASKALPDDPSQRLFGVNARVLVIVGYAALFSILEVPLEMSPHFAWVYPWWGAFPVFVTVYIPFFAAAVYAHDWPRPKQKRFIGGLFAIDALLILIFGPILGWI
ncbi:MAG: hypothetical protein QF570_10555 [Myxococcota bacterium]|nr:hypothetical protein [Myxococcota bacterium]